MTALSPRMPCGSQAESSPSQLVLVVTSGLADHQPARLKTRAQPLRHILCLSLFEPQREVCDSHKQSCTLPEADPPELSSDYGYIGTSWSNSRMIVMPTRNVQDANLLTFRRH